MEFGTNLQAVKCSCGCIMLPQDPLNFNTEWKCESCRELRSAKRNMTIQKSLRNSNELEWNNYYPECNYLLMQMKINRVFMKTSRGKSLEDLTDNDLITVLLDCTVILKRIVQLKLGNTRFKGRLCSRLEKVSKEIERRGVLTEKAEMEDFLECGQAIETQDKLARAKFL